MPLLLIACAGLAAAGCGVTQTTTRTITAVSHGPRERAVADAAAILRAFAVPPGAQRLRRAPDALKIPITSLVTTTLVHDVSFWRAPGHPRAVLAWEQAHLPRRFMPGDADFGPPSWDRMFSLPPVTGVLTTRDLVVEVTAAGHTQTEIRVDADVSWQQPRPARERVPAAARLVTVAYLPSPNPHARRPPAPVTITSLPVVRQLTALTDGLPLSAIPPDASCPAPSASEIRLTFRARPGDPALAVAQGPAECGAIQFTIGGRQQPALQNTSSFIPHVLKLAGLHPIVP